MDRITLSHGFGPFWRPDSRLLILGSFPSSASREAGFYYGHPRNRFWQVLSRLSGEEAPVTMEEKRSFLARKGIALYDVIASCSVVGSSDASIRDAVPTDLSPILEGSRVGDRIFANGKLAQSCFDRFQAPLLGLSCICLPSTSPANASYSLDKLCACWLEKIGPL
ncbi:MAG: DNA-deoxyinosine glycosylase [Clostridia bacterium]|nr:DNA-deoxyinosine glycosylase [Clostridia bacterium]